MIVLFQAPMFLFQPISYRHSDWFVLIILSTSSIINSNIIWINRSTFHHRNNWQNSILSHEILWLLFHVLQSHHSDSSPRHWGRDPIRPTYCSLVLTQTKVWYFILLFEKIKIMCYILQIIKLLEFILWLLQRSLLSLCFMFWLSFTCTNIFLHDYLYFVFCNFITKE